MSLISIKNLSHFFGEGHLAKQVLYGIDLTVNRGEIVILTGHSGSGKTTLLSLIGGLRSVQQGSLVSVGKELNGANERQLVSIRRNIGYIFQAHNLHESLTALQNVRMGLEVHGNDEKLKYDSAAAHMLIQLGLGERLNYLPAKLSGGQKQRVAVARALVGNPEIVFADEPTAALDRESGLRTVQILKRLGEVRGTTTVMVTHDNRILDLADRVIRMENGTIVDA